MKIQLPKVSHCMLQNEWVEWWQLVAQSKNNYLFKGKKEYLTDPV